MKPTVVLREPKVVDSYMTPQGMVGTVWETDTDRVVMLNPMWMQPDENEVQRLRKENARLQDLLLQTTAINSLAGQRSFVNSDPQMLAAQRSAFNPLAALGGLFGRP